MAINFVLKFAYGLPISLFANSNEWIPVVESANNSGMTEADGSKCVQNYGAIFNVKFQLGDNMSWPSPHLVICQYLRMELSVKFVEEYEK